MVSYRCKVCGTEKQVKYKSQIKEYCSHKCANSYSRDKHVGNYKTLVCRVCGKEFKLLESVLRVRKTVKYCSRKCMGIAERKREMVVCKNCGKQFETTRNKFCSRECVSEYRKSSGLVKKNGFWYENGYKVLYIDGNIHIKEHVKIM